VDAADRAANKKDDPRVARQRAASRARRRLLTATRTTSIATLTRPLPRDKTIALAP
jgi:hypothetical protein